MQATNSHTAAQMLTQTTVYSHPTITKLTDFVVALVADPKNFLIASNRVNAIESMVDKYKAGLPKSILEGRNARPTDGLVVLLTGSTGNLGAQLLASLLLDQKVKLVYTLDRPSLASISLEER